MFWLSCQPEVPKRNIGLCPADHPVRGGRCFAYHTDVSDVSALHVK